jgi:hypothetical protein
MPEIGGKIERTVRHTGHVFFPGDKVNLIQDTATGRDWRLFCPGQDYGVLEYASLANMPGFYRAALKRLR